MHVNGSSDLGRLSIIQRRAADTRAALDRAATEMTTGQNTSNYEATAGNLTRLFALDRSLDRNAVFSQTIGLTELRLDTMQDVLGQILSPAEDLAVDLNVSVGENDIAGSLMHAQAARNNFKDTVGLLNTQVAGQSLFSGTATDRPALASADAMLADLDALAQGSATAADAITAIDAYFSKSPPGAFYTSGYVGSANNLSPVDIGDGRRLDYAVRADNDQLVAMLRSQAIGAVVAGGAFTGNSTEQMAILKESGSQMLAAKEGILDLRSAVGISQNALEKAKAARVSEHDALQLARNNIVSVDPTSATSLYQALETQLQSIYTVTSRLANLSFTKFMS